MAQMQTLSIRVPDADFEWLASMDDVSGKTPSEKLRTVLTRARQQHAGLLDHEACTAWMRELVQPLATAAAGMERRERIHSEIVAAALAWTPRLMATLITDGKPGLESAAKAQELEAIIAQQCFGLLAAVLRAGVTSTPATYDANVMQAYLPIITEIAAIISTRTAKE